MLVVIMVEVMNISVQGIHMSNHTIHTTITAKATVDEDENKFMTIIIQTTT